MDLVCAVVKGLEDLGVQQADEEVEGRIIIRDDGVQSALSLSQRVEIFVSIVRIRNFSSRTSSFVAKPALALRAI